MDLYFNKQNKVMGFYMPEDHIKNVHKVSIRKSNSWKEE